MHILKSSDLKPRKSFRARAAFSLVEVTMAVGIVGFAFISVLGMIPTGLNTFRQAVDATVGAQVVQRVLNESQQTDFDKLITDKSGNTIAVGAMGLKAVRYFDDQASEVKTAATAIYHVNTRVMPATSMPNNASYGSLATVTVQIVNNPGNQAINSDATTKLWSDARFSVTTAAGLVGRTK